MARLTLRRPEPQTDSTDDALAFLGGIALGALVGATCAIFLAPSDGQTLRRRVRSTLGLGEPEPPAAEQDASGAAGEPLLTPRDVPAEERVAQDRVPAYSH